jgi:hypothetical protein
MLLVADRDFHPASQGSHVHVQIIPTHGHTVDVLSGDAKADDSAGEDVP